MSPSSACRRTATGLLCVLGAGLATAGSASASAADQMWNCRASAALHRHSRRRTAPSRSSPTAARAPRSRALIAPAAPTTTPSPSAPGSELGLTGPIAKTSVDPDSGLAVDQSVSAQSSVVDFAPGQAGNNLVVRGARAEATAVCTANGPAPDRLERRPGASPSAAGRSTSTQAQETVERLPTGAIVRIKFNEQTRSASSLVQRAVHLEVQDPAGRIVKDVVVAEAKVSGGSEVCDRAAQEDTANGGDGNAAAGRQQPVHPRRRVRRRATTSASSRASATATSPTAARPSTIVGTPVRGPQRRPRRPALRGAEVGPEEHLPEGQGRQVPRPRHEEGRPHHRLQPRRRDLHVRRQRQRQRRPRQRLHRRRQGRRPPRRRGRQGHADRRLGRDNLNGGSEADKLYGGAGNDSINAAYGRDRVKGGKGNDAINVATAGPAARVNCGKGKDVVRSNTNERRRIRGCERRYSIR